MQPMPTVPWDVVALELTGTEHTILLARVWIDVLDNSTVDRDWVRTELANILEQRPDVAALAATIARPGNVRALPPAEQCNWLVEQVRTLAV